MPRGIVRSSGLHKAVVALVAAYTGPLTSNEMHKLVRANCGDANNKQLVRELVRKGYIEHWVVVTDAAVQRARA